MCETLDCCSWWNKLRRKWCRGMDKQDFPVGTWPHECDWVRAGRCSRSVWWRLSGICGLRPSYRAVDMYRDPDPQRLTECRGKRLVVCPWLAFLRYQHYPQCQMPMIESLSCLIMEAPSDVSPDDDLRRFCLRIETLPR
jgi:hypothetical protein